MPTPEEEKIFYEQTSIVKDALLNRIDEVTKEIRISQSGSMVLSIDTFQSVAADLIADPYWGPRAKTALKDRFSDYPEDSELTPIAMMRMFKEEVGDYGSVHSIILGRFREFIAKLER